jgi:hypothetical protein
VAGPLPSLSQVARKNGDAVVRVLSVEGRHLSSGFVVATVGYAVAVLPRSKAGDRVVVELARGERRTAVVARKEKGGELAMLRLHGAHEHEVFASLPIADEKKAALGGWLVALCHDETQALSPSVGGLRQIREDGTLQLDLPCRAGAPVLDASGKVVAVTLRSMGRTSSVGVPAKRVLTLAQTLAQAPAPKEITPVAAGR